MKIETYHPFEVILSRSYFEPDSYEILVNQGTVYNFYNPANFRITKIDRDGLFLEKLPISVAIQSKDKEKKRVDPIRVIGDYTKIEIYLFASFLPPVKWVPSAFFIPKVDEVWLVFKIYQDNEEKPFFYIGNTKNSKPEHIRYEAHKAQEFNLENPNAAIYENEIDWNGNAFNLGIIASLEKKDGEWTIKQFIKEHFPVTFFFNFATYEMANSDRFSIDIQSYEDEEDLDAQLDKINLIGLLFSHYSFAGENYRGYINYCNNLMPDDDTVGMRQPVFPTMSYTQYNNGILYFRP
jgi:hypothetical protein